MWEDAWFGAIWSRLAVINAKLDVILRKEKDIIMTLDDITNAVAAEQTVEASAITLLNQLAAEVAAAANDPAKIQAIVTQIQTNAATLAAAVTANTPAAPAPAPATPAAGS